MTLVGRLSSTKGLESPACALPSVTIVLRAHTSLSLSGFSLLAVSLSACQTTKMSSSSASKLMSQFCIFLGLLLFSFPSTSAWTCESSCGGIALNYPFGYGWQCGSPLFQPYVNCSHGRLLFYTPTGTYQVQSIDYVNKVMVIQDPHMSTCSNLQSSQAFGLPIGSPFSFTNYDTVALIGCSSTSSLYASQTCDSTAGQICESFYSSCPGVSSELGLASNAPSSSCCVYSNSLLRSPPYEIDLPLLECSSYTSIYRIGDVHDAKNSWLYGIVLQFSYSAPSPPTNNKQPVSCYVCEVAEDNRGSSSRMPFRTLWIVVVSAILGYFGQHYFVTVPR